MSPGVVRSVPRSAGRASRTAFPIAPIRRQVVLYAVPLAIGRAALDPDDEQHDDEDRERDQRDQAKERRQVARTGETPPRRARAAAAGRPGPRSPGSSHEGGVLLVEEVEVENVFVARTHAPPWRDSRRCDRSVPPERSTQRQESAVGGQEGQRCRPSRLSLPPMSWSWAATGPCVRSEAEAPAPSGSRSTSGTASTSRSRSSPARERPQLGPSGRRSQLAVCATSAACARTTSGTTRATCTSRTSTSRAARFARRCERTRSRIAMRSRSLPRCSTRSRMPIAPASSTATSSRRTSCSSTAKGSPSGCSTSASRSSTARTR